MAADPQPQNIAPNTDEFPDFDNNLRDAFRRETELFFDSIVREDRNVLDLMTADYTFVNERLAKHYGLPDVYGSQFRRVTLADEARRGLLGKGSILLVTSHADRTAPTLRGKWILENLLGTPPPAPPANVPPFEQTAGPKPRTIRERMEIHRANPSCASCHRSMDALGFTLENFNAVGAWRTRDAGYDVNAQGTLADGEAVVGVAGLRAALLKRPEIFVETLTEKLMTYGLGRGLQYYDMPVIRGILRDAAASGQPLLFDHSWHREERAVPDAQEGGRRNRCRRVVMFVTKRALSRRTLLARNGHDARAAVSRVDGPGVLGACTDAGEAAAAVRRGLLSERRPDEFLDAEGTGGDLEITPILKPLEAFRDQMTVVGNLSRAGGKTVTDHAVSSAGWLSGVVAKQTEAEDISLGVTIDQVIARQVGQDTPFPSLEFATEDFSGYVGGCVPGLQLHLHEHHLLGAARPRRCRWRLTRGGVRTDVRPRRQCQTSGSRACARTAASSIRSPTKLASSSAGLARRTARGSTSTSAPCARSSGGSRRPKPATRTSVTDVAAPIGVPEAFEDHAALLFDLLAVAYQADLTRVFTFMMAREASQRTYPVLAIPETHHDVSHHGNQPEKMALHAKIDTHFASLFAAFIDKLRNAPDGDGSVLDHSLIVFGARHERRAGALRRIRCRSRRLAARAGG